MGKRKKKRRSTETSKLILYISYVLAVSITATVVILLVFEKSVAGLDTIALAAWGEVTAANSLYLLKARRENKAKYAQQFIREMAEKYGVERIGEILGVVLQD